MRVILELKSEFLSIQVGPNLESGKGYGVATPPGSDLRDQLNLAVLELKEMDWIARLYRLWWEERGECGKMEEASDVRGRIFIQNLHCFALKCP